MASFAEALALTFLPATCALCRASLPWGGSRAGICAGCWERLPLHRGPVCPVCGDPEATSGGACLSCRADPPPWRAAATLGPYEGELRDLVLLFKNRGRDELAAPIATLLARRLRGGDWKPPDVVVSVPMTWLRRIRRGYDQAELLGRGVAREIGTPFSRVLRRRAGGGPQVGRSRSERLRLAARSFEARRPVAGRVLLVDDVITTGATAACCARALARAGADEICVLAIARTPQPGRIP